MAGYSKRSLKDKLGIKDGQRVYIAGAPAGYDRTLGPLGAVTRKQRLSGSVDFIQFFTKKRSELEAKIVKFKEAIRPAGMIWISWPKGSSGVATDLNENHVREIALANGLVDVKVAAVDEVWSGLKLVIPLKDR